MHIMAQNVGNDDTPDIYKLYGFWIGMLFAIVKKHFFAFCRDLWGRVFVKNALRATSCVTSCRQHVTDRTAVTQVTGLTGSTGSTADEQFR